MNLRIEISEGDGYGSVSIVGVDFPEPPDDTESFQAWDAKWTSICNGIHALVGELGPIPDKGLTIKFWVNNAPLAQQ